MFTYQVCNVGARSCGKILFFLIKFIYTLFLNNLVSNFNFSDSMIMLFEKSFRLGGTRGWISYMILADVYFSATLQYYTTKLDLLKKILLFLMCLVCRVSLFARSSCLSSTHLPCFHYKASLCDTPLAQFP